jgi:hypothetical protein
LDLFFNEEIFFAYWVIHAFCSVVRAIPMDSSLMICYVPIKAAANLREEEGKTYEAHTENNLFGDLYLPV